MSRQGALITAPFRKSSPHLTCSTETATQSRPNSRFSKHLTKLKRTHYSPPSCYRWKSKKSTSSVSRIFLLSRNRGPTLYKVKIFPAIISNIYHLLLPRHGSRLSHHHPTPQTSPIDTRWTHRSGGCYQGVAPEGHSASPAHSVSNLHNISRQGALITAPVRKSSPHLTCSTEMANQSSFNSRFSKHLTKLKWKPFSSTLLPLKSKRTTSSVSKNSVFFGIEDQSCTKKKKSQKQFQTDTIFFFHV